MNGNDQILETEPTSAPDALLAARKCEFTPIRIWLVDDNSAFRSLLVSLLECEGGFDCVRQFSSPPDVLKALAEGNGPDVILLDIEMGEHNGLDAIRPIKALAPQTHVLMLTTFAAPGARQQAFREGASDFMLKTWTMAEIALHIRQATEFGSVAGLVTAFLSPVQSGEKGLSMRETESIKKAPIKSTLVERWLNSLRGWWKFSPS